MKRLASVLALLLSTGAASAASWDGFYVGLYAGPNIQQGHATTTTTFSGAGYFASSSVTAINAVGGQHPSTTGVNFGGLVGFNWTIGGNWVAGLEADMGINADESSTGSGDIYPCCTSTSFGIVSKTRTRWVFTARPRLGYSWDDMLAYVTAGVAMTDLKSSFIFTDTYADAHASGFFNDTRVAWTAGGGIEKQLDSDVSARFEYLYADFGSIGGTSANLLAYHPRIAYPANVFAHNASLTEHMFRMALTLKL
jgi:outer membrane immunogenic protein